MHMLYVSNKKSDEPIKQRLARNEQLRKERNANLPTSISKETTYPHVYGTQGGSTLSAFGTKYTLPAGTERYQDEMYEEVIIPYSKKRPEFQGSEGLIPISQLSPLCRGTLGKYKTLNRIQSIVYPVAFQSNENMLVCAPTGAGKTDVALLTMLKTIDQFSTYDEQNQIYDIDYDGFKIVYVAPLKALAAEIVEKMSTRLAWLGISVRELTGDMQLTKHEIQATQIIVTTPEKWDVVSRKGGENELTSKVKLLVIDEVHLLHEERGAVIESLVARTLRQVESSQSLIRIVGLSATLPNFIDVAEFLHVNPQQGLFFFDSSFRPVPLKQIFMGVRGKQGSKQAIENIDRVAYDKLVDMLREGHQVMVFVHSRKDTVKTARTFIQMAQVNGDLDLFDCSEASSYDHFKRDMSKYKNKDMKELFDRGFGVHHAGMVRSDRNTSEKMFATGSIKILCCTATLAWGVNVPAAVVIIKGTQVYDSKRGGYADLGISDVIQIFGRAGRPQFEKYGTGILCTTSDRLDHYLSAITQQHPIESKLMANIADNLNAEISLGTVTNVDEGVQWLGYTYLYVRMRKNPLAYGIIWSELSQDPLLGNKRRQLIVSAAQRLHDLQMIIFDSSDSFISKDAGRIASDFYLLNNSIEVFNKMLNPRASEADALAMISMSGEFDSLKFRQEEEKELKELKEQFAPCQVAGSDETSSGKANILLQAYISKATVQESALISDSNYVAQNAVRITRALFQLAINRRWGRLARMFLSICKSIDRRQWSFEHPLAQFELPLPVLRNLEVKNPSVYDMKEMDASELGDLVHNSKMGSKIARYADLIPLLDIHADILPITNKVLRVHIDIEPNFVWDTRVHGKGMLFHIWVEEDNEKGDVLHVDKLFLTKGQLKEPHLLDFNIPLSDPAPDQLIIRAVSDTWIGGDSMVPVSFQYLIRPEVQPIQTKLLKLRPLPVEALKNTVLEGIYKTKFDFFNPMQTMVFNTLYHQDTNVLLGSPTGSGKTVACELAMWAAFRDNPKSKVVYIAPMKALVRERVEDWSKKLVKATGRKLIELTGDTNPDAQSVRNSDIIITTPEKFDGISRNWQTRTFVQEVSLIIMDEIHLLASDRGPILEMIVSRMNFVQKRTGRRVRLLGMSTAVANAGDLADWLGVRPNGLFNFPSSVRPVPLQMYIDGFRDMGFGPLMKSMNRPAYMAIKRHASTKPVLVFVASRRQTRLTAQDLISLCGMEENPRRFLRMTDSELEAILTRVKDETLRLSLQFGIGLHHAGLRDIDRRLSHELFESGKIQVLIATATLAWGVNLPAYLVIIKGTQFYDFKLHGYKDMNLTDVLQMMGRAGRPAFDTNGVAVVFTKESTKNFYKYFLNSGFPVESSLHKQLADHLGAEISGGTVRNKQEAVEFLSWTFLFRRIHHNPTYYGVEGQHDGQINNWLAELVDRTVASLVDNGCLIQSVASDGDLTPSLYLNISTFYYISHKTMGRFLQALNKSNFDMKECLKTVAMSAEYDELAVRHNEDAVNEEVSSAVRYHGSALGLPMGNEHVKAFLLIQAHIQRIELPIEDYIQDTVAVMDQTLRLLQAAIDTAGELGSMSGVYVCVELIRSIKLAKWASVRERASKVNGNSKVKFEVNKDGDIINRDDTKKGKPAFQATVLFVDRVQTDGNVLITIEHPTLNSVHGPVNPTPRFTKAQTESWITIVVKEGEIVSLQRLGPRQKKQEFKVKVPLGCDVLMLNDCLEVDIHWSPSVESAV